MELVENRIVHRFIRNIAEYETGEYSNTVIGTDVQAYAIYPETEESGKSGLYYVIGDDIHTYTEIRDGQGATLAAKEYPVFSEDFIGEIDKCATKEEIDAAVAVEKERAESAEATLNDAINTETERATTKEKEIEDKHTQEITAIEGTITAINEALTDHKNDRENPHVVTKEQVGLGNVDNTADLDKPISTAVSEEIKKVNTAITSEADRAKQAEADLNIAIENEVTRAKGIEAELTKEITDEALRATEAEGNITTALNAHKDNVNNPHSVTKAQVGLGNVDNTSDINKPISSATQEALDNIIDSVEAEVTRAEEAEKVLDTSIKAEVTRATEAEASLTTEIEKKANKATTLAGYNISDAYTKSEVDGKLAGAFHYKGTVETEADLPKDGNEQGDVWNVSETGANYAWDGEKFDKLSETIDLSAYALKTELPTELPNPNALTLKVNNEDFVVYNGSEAVEKNLEIYADNIPLKSDTSLTIAWQLERLTPMFIQIPIRSLQDKVYTQEEIFGWFGVTDVIGIKNKFGLPVSVYMMYNVTNSGLPHVYKFPVEYAAFESQNQIKMVFQGLNTMNDVVSKYEIIINLDGTVIEGNSNVKMTITSLEPSA